jgi:hypothetical protein
MLGSWVGWPVFSVVRQGDNREGSLESMRAGVNLLAPVGSLSTTALVWWEV